MVSLKFLTKEYPLGKSYFIISKFCLNWVGAYPKTESSILRYINCCIHFFVLFSAVVSQFWYGFYYLKIDVLIGVDALCLALPMLVAFLKMIFIIWNGKEIARELCHMKTILFADLSEENNKIIQEFAVKATKLALMVLTAGVLANIFYSLRPLVTNMFRLSKGLNYIYDETPLRVMLPSVLLTMPWYPFAYAYVSYMAQVCVITFSGVDGLFISFCLYAAALLKILQNDMRKIFEKYQTHMSADENRECFEQLRRIIRRHNEIIDLVKRFSVLFTWITLVHFFFSSIIIGASIIEALIFPGLRAVVSMTFTLSVSSELFIYCFGGSAIIENSFEFGMSAYFLNWYNCDNRLRRDILFIIIRSQKALTMDVPFFAPSLVTFTSIIRTAGSFIAVAKSIL